MAQQVEVAQLYYTLGARTDASAQRVVAEQGTALDDLAETAKAAGVPLGALQAAVAQLVDEVEGELTAAVAQMGKEMDATGVSAASLAQRTAAITEASAASTAALSAQVRVYAAGTQITSTRQQSLAQLSAIEAQLKGRLEQGNLTLEQRIRLEALLAQTQVATVTALGRTSGALSTVARSTQTTGALVKDFGAKWSGTALNVVTAASSIVQSGNVSSGGLKSVLLGATSLAGFLGAGGALVVAAGVAANAIISVFTRAREEAKKAADDVAAEIARLQNAGDTAGLTAKAQTLFEGTAAGGYKDGIRALRAELAALDQQIASAGVFGQLDAKTKEERAKVAATLQQLEADFARTREAIENPARPATPDRLPIRVTTTSTGADADGLRKRAEATAAGAAAFRDVRQAVEDLVGSIGSGESVLGAFDRRVREIEDAFAKLKAPTAEQTTEFTRLREAAAAARASLATLQGQRAAEELRKIEASLTPSILDDMAVATRQLAAELKSLNASPEVTARILGLKQAIDDATISGNALDDRLTAIATSGAGPLRQMIALGEVRREKEAELLGLTAKGEAADRRRATIKAQIAKIQAEEARLAGDQATADAASVESATQLLTVVQDVATAALGMATAFLGADATLTKMIAGAAQVAAGLSRVSELADKAGGLSKLFSTGGGIASALPAIGGIVGGVAAIAAQFGESPAQKEARELLRRNNERLEQLRQTLGDALKQSSSGATLSGARRALNSANLIDNPAREFQLLSIASLTEQLKKLGLTMADLKRIAKDAEIELSDSPTVDQLQQLQKYLNDLDFAGFANSFEGAMQRLNAEFELFPDQFRTNVERFKAILEELNNAEFGAPKLFGELAKIDTTTAEGKQAALAEIQRLFKLYAENKLTADDLNGLNLQQFFEMLTRLKQELGDLPQEKSAADRFSDALDALGVQLEFGTLDVSERLDKMREVFANLFPDLAASLDTSSAEAFKASVKAIVDGFAADGELTDAERAQIDVLRALMEAFDASSDAAADLAAKAEEAMLAARALVFTLADAFLQVNDITDPIEILKVKAAALVKAFPALADVMGQFDLSTQAGRDALEAWIRSLIDSPDALAAMAKSLGITVEELVGQLLGLESAADSAAEKVATLADKLSTAFDEVQFGIDLEGISDPIEKLKRTVSGIAGILPEIDEALAGLDLTREAGRKEAEQRLVALGSSTTDPAIRKAILSLLGQLRNIPAASSGAGASASDGTGDGRVTTRPQNVDARFSAFASATVGQVDSMLTMLTRIQENTKTVAEFYLRGAGSVRAPVLPQLPQLVATATAGAGGLVINVYATINIGPGVGAETARVALDEGGSRIRRQIEEIVETGGAQRLIRSQRLRGVPLQT